MLDLNQDKFRNYQHPARVRSEPESRDRYFEQPQAPIIPGIASPPTVNAAFEVFSASDRLLDQTRLPQNNTGPGDIQFLLWSTSDPLITSVAPPVLSTAFFAFLLS